MWDKHRQLSIVVCLDYFSVPCCISLYNFILWFKDVCICRGLKKTPSGSMAPHLPTWPPEGSCKKTEHGRKMCYPFQTSTEHLLCGNSKIKKKSGALPFRNLKPPEEKRYKELLKNIKTAKNVKNTVQWKGDIVPSQTRQGRAEEPSRRRADWHYKEEMGFRVRQGWEVKTWRGQQPRRLLCFSICICLAS